MLPLDFDAIRRGFYTDAYFNNIRTMLEKLAAEKATLQPVSPLPHIPQEHQKKHLPGEAVVEMQIFHKRDFAVTCGIDHALCVLQNCCGFFEGDKFINTYDHLEIEALRDGDTSVARRPVLKIRGRYRDFGYLETVLLGLIARETKIATNAYLLQRAAGKKPVLFFPARFDLPTTQAFDGYAYFVGVSTCNRLHNTNIPPLVATPAQASLWGGKATGTTAHALIMCFLRDTTAAMLQFARLMPPEVKRIALVDSNNDCVGDSIRVALAFFERFCTLKERGAESEAEKFRLFGVRADTAEDVIDVSLKPHGPPGVVPQLTKKMRHALDQLAKRDWPDHKKKLAEEFFPAIKIVASGGFDVEKIEWFEKEEACVDFYGVGSAYFKKGQCDHTADVVRVRVGTRWYECAKVGRAPWDNPDLRRVK